MPSEAGGCYRLMAENRWVLRTGQSQAIQAKILEKSKRTFPSLPPPMGELGADLRPLLPAKATAKLGTGPSQSH